MTIEYVVRYCRKCGHTDPPVHPDRDMWKNKCPKCKEVMVSGIRDVPDGRVVTNGEECIQVDVDLETKGSILNT